MIIDRGSFVAPVRVTRAYEELAAAIRRRIQSGELRVGDRIPSEKDLAHDAQVSRPTVREALRTLEEAGLIERASPRILVVRGQTDRQTFRVIRQAFERSNVTFAHVQEALLVLEPHLIQLATARATDAELEGLTRNIVAQGEALNDPAAWNRLSREFHLAIGEAAGNPVLLLARTSLSELLTTTLRSLYDSPEATRRVYSFHVRIVEDMAARDAEGAAHASRRLIRDFRQMWEEAGHDVDVPVAQLPSDGPSLSPVA